MTENEAYEKLQEAKSQIADALETMKEVREPLELSLEQCLEGEVFDVIYDVFKIKCIVGGDCPNDP